MGKAELLTTQSSTRLLALIITSSGDQIQLLTGTSQPTLRISIPASGVVAGNTIRLSYLGQSQTPQTITSSDINNGYVDVYFIN